MTGVRMGRRPLAAMALGWLLVVAAVAAVTFVVVDRAGRGVGQASAARTVAALPLATASPSRPAPDAPPTTAGPAPTRTTTRAPRPTTTRTTVPTPSPTLSTPRPDVPTLPGPASTPTLRPAEPRTLSFTTEGGTVVATCAGTVLTLESITPRDGWRFGQESDGEGLEVRFRPGAGGAGDAGEVEIVLACVGGTPTRRAG